jgi:hypothetical protein
MKIRNPAEMLADLADGDWRYREGPDRGAGMDGTIEQLYVAIRYLEMTFEGAEPLLQPLRDLLDDLMDLHEGRKPERLRPVKGAGQPPTKVGQTRRRARLAALMDLLIGAGNSEDDAMNAAARVSRTARPGQVRYWRQRAQEGTDKALSMTFNTAVETWLGRYEGDPERAAKALKEALSLERF